MDGSKRTLFLVASLCVFLAALGISSVRLAVRYSENLRRAQSVFQSLRSSASRAVLQPGPPDEAWRALARSIYRDDDSVLMVVLHAQGSGIIHMVPRSAPYLAASPQTASVPPELYYPPQTVSRLSAVVGTTAGAPVTMELLYSLLRQRDVYEAARVGLILASSWTALALLILTVAGLRRAEPAVSRPDTRTASSRESGSFSSGTGLRDEDFVFPELPKKQAPITVQAPPDEILRPAPVQEAPNGLYSPDSGLGWSAYLPERLGAELSRAASFEQDLVLLELSHEGIARDSTSYSVITRVLLEFFTFRDLVFEQGPSDLAVILPNIDSDHAIRMAEEFLKKVSAVLREEGSTQEHLKIFLGLSSRSGRLVDAERVITEARAALARAREEGDSRIMAFKADPNKYRNYLAAKS